MEPDKRFMVEAYRERKRGKLPHSWEYVRLSDAVHHVVDLYENESYAEGWIVDMETGEIVFEFEDVL